MAGIRLIVGLGRINSANINVIKEVYICKLLKL